MSHAYRDGWSMPTRDVPHPSKRSVISLTISGPPSNHPPIRLPHVSRSAEQRAPSGNQFDKISSGALPLLFHCAPITRPAPAAAAGVRRHGRFEHHQHRVAQSCSYPPLASHGHCYHHPPTKPDRRVSPARPGRGPPSSRGLSSASIAPLPRSGVSARCNDSHVRRVGASPK